MNQYTIVYAVTRKIIPGSRECYHHLARVAAPSLDRAIDRCRADTLAGFDFQLLAAFADADSLVVGGACLAHTFSVADDA